MCTTWQDHEWQSHTLIRIPRWRVLARDAWAAWAAYYQALSEETIGLLRGLR